MDTINRPAALALLDQDDRDILGYGGACVRSDDFKYQHDSMKWQYFASSINYAPGVAAMDPKELPDKCISLDLLGKL